MNKRHQYDNIVRNVAALLLMLGASGCASQRAVRTEVQTIVYDQNAAQTPPGVVEYIWEEPMVDVIDVPPGLDPEGIYYRPAHQEVVEIRQGHWNYYKKRGESP